MNATMIWVRTCNRKRFTETTARSNVSTVITIVIGCDRVRHVIIILPGNRGSCCHSNCGWCKSHIYYANCIGFRRGIIASTAALGTRNQYGREQQTQTHYTGNSIFHYLKFKL
jgi:hypothetical protein